MPYVNRETGEPFACGKCPACALRRANSWAFRCSWEARRSLSVHWIRLSYDSDHLPIASNGRASLEKTHLDDFFCNLRNSYRCRSASLGCVVRGVRYPPDRPKIKYFLCGEYGSQFKRPHYHVLLFNADERNFVDSWRDRDGSPLGEVWIDDRPFELASVVYTCGYMLKPCTAGYGTDTRTRKFHHMSKGLGTNYLTDKQIRWHLADPSRQFITLPTGVRLSLPRYYKDKIKSSLSNAELATYEEDCERWYLDNIAPIRDVKFNAAVAESGGIDNYWRDAAQARRASIINFQKTASSRSDHVEI